jgi:hypothetical protein
MNVGREPSASLFIICLVMMITLPVAVAEGVWHTHLDEFHDNCAACHFCMISAVELSIQLQIQPLVIVSRSVATAAHRKIHDQILDSTSSRAPPSLSHF